MKKNYTKPQIAYEEFIMNCSIAACKITDPNDPRLEFSGLQVFVDNNSCDVGVKDPVLGNGGDGTYNGICYDIPIEGFNYWNS